MEPNFLKTVSGGAHWMHRTRSVDYAVVLAGEIDMTLDDSGVHLKPGDVVIQQATNHALDQSREAALPYSRRGCEAAVVAVHTRPRSLPGPTTARRWAHT